MAAVCESDTKVQEVRAIQVHSSEEEVTTCEARVVVHLVQRVTGVIKDSDKGQLRVVVRMDSEMLYSRVDGCSPEVLVVFGIFLGGVVYV